jgi:Protein of unknown function (DUF2846)
VKTLIGLFLLLATTSLEAADSKGYVVVYRLKKFQGSALSPAVACDGQEAAKMSNGRFFTLALTPGSHQLTTNNKEALEVVVKPNQVQYVQLIIEVGMAKGHGKLLLMGEGQGNQDASLVTALSADKVKNSSIVMTSLPAPEVSASSNQSAATAMPAAPEPPKDAPAAAPVRRTPSQPPLNADTILQMKNSGLGDELIVTMAQKRGLSPLGAEAMIKLKSAGMSDQSLSQLLQLVAP